MIFLKKKKKDHGNMIFSSNVLKKWSFQKQLHWNMMSHKNIILFFRRKMKSYLSQKINGNIIFKCPENMVYHQKKCPGIWFFLYIWKDGIFFQTLPFCKKQSKMAFSQKNTLKVDWLSRSHSRKGSNDSLYFHGYLFSTKVDRTFLKVYAKCLVKVTTIGEVMRRKRPPTLRKISFEFLYENNVIEACCLNYGNNWYSNKHGEY